MRHHLPNWGCITGNNAATSCHSLQETPTEYEWDSQIEMHITTGQNPVIIIGLKRAQANECVLGLMTNHAFSPIPPTEAIVST